MAITLTKKLLQMSGRTLCLAMRTSLRREVSQMKDRTEANRSWWHFTRQWDRETQQDGQSSAARIVLAGPECTLLAPALGALGSQGCKQVALGLCVCKWHAEGCQERMLVS